MAPPTGDETGDKKRSHHHHHSSHHHKSHHHQSKSHHHKSHRQEKKEHRQSDRRSKSPGAKSPSRPTSKTERKTHHHHHHHHQSHHVQHVSGEVVANESGRHPSSSLGPGHVEYVVSIILIILAISAIVLLCLGLWLLIARTGWPSGLDNTGSIAWTRFISYATACIIVAILFIPLIFLALWAAVAKRGSRARKLRLAVVFLATLSALLLLLMTATALLIATSPPFIHTITERSWFYSVEDAPNSGHVCDIQNRYNCDGWEDNSCLNCQPTTDGNYNTQAGVCTDFQKTVCPPCYLPSRSIVQTRSNPKPKQIVKKGSKANAAMNRSKQRLHLKIPTFGKRRLNLLQQQRQQQQQVRIGCRRYIEWRNREFFIPMCVYTLFLIFVLILLSWKMCIDSSGRWSTPTILFYTSFFFFVFLPFSFRPRLFFHQVISTAHMGHVFVSPVYLSFQVDYSTSYPPL